MPSFDVVSEVQAQEVKNAIEQANREIGNRFDFKGSDARIEQKDLELTVYADDEFKLGQVMEILRNRLAKRNVDVRALEPGSVEKISGDKVKQPVKVRTGVPQEKGKQIVKLLKDARLKVNASIQGDAVLRAGREEGRPAGRHPARAAVGEGPAPAVHELPRLRKPVQRS